MPGHASSDGRGVSGEGKGDRLLDQAPAFGDFFQALVDLRIEILLPAVVADPSGHTIHINGAPLEVKSHPEGARDNLSITEVAQIVLCCPLHRSLHVGKRCDDHQRARWQEATDDPSTSTVDCLAGHLVSDSAQVSCLPPNDPAAKDDVLNILGHKAVFGHLLIGMRTDAIALLDNRLAQPQQGAHSVLADLPAWLRQIAEGRSDGITAANEVKGKGQPRTVEGLPLGP